MKTSFSKIAGVGLLAALAAGLVSAPASAQSLYGVTFFDSQFLTIDGATGTTAQVGSLSPGVKPDGLAVYNNNYYTFNAANNTLLQLNGTPMLGGTRNTFPVGITGPVAPGGLAISKSGLAFLAVPDTTSPPASPTSTLYAFNLTGGAPVTVGTTNDLLSGLAFDSNDTLYGLGKGDGQLFTINTADGAGTLVGNLDPSGTAFSLGDPIGAITFSGNTLFAASGSNLYTVSTTTGAGTLVGPIADDSGIPFNSVSGLAPGAVPETSNVLSFGALLALGGLFLVRRRVRQS